MTLAVRRWWVLLPAYLVSGLALGLADPSLGWLALALGSRPGLATAVSVNVLLPIVAAALAVAQGRLSGAWLGAALMTLGLVAGLSVQYAKAAPDWSPLAVLSSIPPILVLAGLGYGAIGTAAVFAARFTRKRTTRAETPSDPH